MPLQTLLAHKHGSVLDIGANVGIYSLLAAYAGLTVLAFEPMPRNRALLAATLCANPVLARRITVHPVALGERRGECKDTNE